MAVHKVREFCHCTRDCALMETPSYPARQHPASLHLQDQNLKGPDPQDEVMSRAMPRACTSAQRQPPLAAMRSSLACGAARGLRDGTVTRARRQSVGLQRQARASVA